MNEGKENEPEVDEAKGTEDAGESAAEEQSGAQQPAVDYGVLIEKLNAIEANQTSLASKVQALTDAQSVLVDAGAIVREIPADNIVTDEGGEDAFIPLEELDLSI